MDILYWNGRFRTLDPHVPVTGALLARGGRIAALGEAAIAAAGPGTQRVDLEGAHGLPGLTDTHMHLMEYGVTLGQVQLADCASLEEMGAAVRTFIEGNRIPAGSWVLGRGWNQEKFACPRLPDRYDLDRMAPGHPLALTRVCGHVAVANSLALRVCGVTRHTPSPQGGAIGHGQDGEPDGRFYENALPMIAGPAAAAQEELEQLILRAARRAAASGLTCVHTDDLGCLPGLTPERVFAAYLALERAGKLPVRVVEQCLIASVEQLEGFFAQGYRRGWGNEGFALGPIKYISDGSLGARTAYLSQPYADDPYNRGMALADTETLYRLARLAQAHHTPLAVHAIGDAAIGSCVQALRAAPMPAGEPAHGIVHCQITGPDLLRGIAKAGLQVYAQPVFLASDARMLVQRVGEERAASSYAWRTLLGSGVNLSGGSDCPVEDLSPLQNIYCAMARKDLDGWPEGGFHPEQNLSAGEAVELFTQNAARASGHEAVRGRLAVGMQADLTLLSQDLLTAEAEAIPQTRVLGTIVGGKLWRD